MAHRVSLAGEGWKRANAQTGNVQPLCSQSANSVCFGRIGPMKTAVFLVPQVSGKILTLFI